MQPCLFLLALHGYLPHTCPCVLASQMASELAVPEHVVAKRLRRLGLMKKARGRKAGGQGQRRGAVSRGGAGAMN